MKNSKALFLVMTTLLATHAARADVVPLGGGVRVQRSIQISAPPAPAGKLFVLYPHNPSDGAPLENVVRLNTPQDLRVGTHSQNPSVYLVDAGYAGNGSDLNSPIGEIPLPSNTAPSGSPPSVVVNVRVVPQGEGFALEIGDPREAPPISIFTGRREEAPSAPAVQDEAPMESEGSPASPTENTAEESSASESAPQDSGGCSASGLALSSSLWCAALLAIVWRRSFSA